MLSAGHLSLGHLLVYELRKSGTPSPIHLLALEPNTVPATKKAPTNVHYMNTCMHHIDHIDTTNMLYLYVIYV